MQVRVGRGRRGLLLASSSLAAILISGGAPSAYAACITQNGGTVASVSNSSPAGNCILIENGANVTGNVVNTGTLTANGVSPTSTGITITNSTIGGTVTNSGTITAKSQGVIVENNASVLGGISNSGTISASHFGVVIGNSNVSTTIATFGGGIGNSGTISSANRSAVMVGGGLLSGSRSITVSNFSGGISNSGTLTASALAVMVGGEAENSATITVSTFSGGITNSGTGTITGGDGVIVGGEAFTSAQVTVSTFGGGITNAGTISGTGSGGAGILVGGAATGSASLALSTFSGGISNSGVISGAFGVLVGLSAADSSTLTLGTFSGSTAGITNSGTGTIKGGQYGVFVGGIVGSKAQATISTFSGGITNSGTISGGKAGVFVGGTGIGSNTSRFTISTFAGGISNSGTISGGRGIWVGGSVVGSIVVLSTFSGGITNSGTIGGGTGIFVGADAILGGAVTISTFSGGVTNTGKIAVSTAGIAVSGITIGSFGGNVSNAGLITAATGILVNASVTIGGIVDSGTILGRSLGIGVGAGSTINTSHTAILVSGPTLSGGIGNAGTISAAGAGILVGGTTGHGAANVSSFSGNISNAGTITAKTAIAITDATIQGQIVDSGIILASSHGIFIDGASKISTTKTAIVVSGGTLAGGISNAGTISAAGGRGVFIGGAFAVSGSTTDRGVTVPSFGGGISNAGTITASNAGIEVGGKAAIVGTSNQINITISTFSGGITNSGAISAGGNGILVGGTATAAGPDNHADVTISAFSGGISNNGTITAVGIGIEVGGTTSVVRAPATAAIVTISTFAGGITNSGTIGAQTGILVNAHVLTFSGAIANSGTISASGGTAIDVSGANNAITINQSAGLISGAIKLSAHADLLNISGGTINGNIVGSGSSDTINFNMGSGTFTYGSAYGFSGINQVNINSGTVVLDGTNNASAVDVIGGTLAGTGTLDPLTMTIHSGGTFSPGTPGVPGTSMTITGNLAFQSGALYVVYLNSTSTFANVSGTASLAGTVNANFASGSGLARQYTILESSGLGGTTFSSLNLVGLPTNINASLSYSADDVFIDLALSLPTGNFNVNQQNAGNALANFFNSGGALPNNFASIFGLSGTGFANALTKLDGEASTDAQKGAFQLMNDFLDLMLDPSAGGGGGISGGGANGFAPEQDTSLPEDVALAYAKALKQKSQAPSQINGGGLGNSFDQRWTAWGSAFGGTNWTKGDPVIGSNNVNASDYGFAAGMEYHATPNFTYGFGFAGGGTNWNLAQGLGDGRSDSFQAGVYAKTHAGPAYVSAALAFANHWFTTTRTAALGDELQAKFDGQSYAARGEVGYRYGLPVTGYIVGVTPYAALQVQDFHTPNYSETDLTGSGFGLSYAAQSATDTRSELGARFDNLQVVDGMPLILRGRLAWAHDWVTDPSLGAVFQALPGSNFTVTGATQPKNSALTTAAAELHLTANWTAIAKFDGEFAAGAQTYGGTGTLRYSW